MFFKVILVVQNLLHIQHFLVRVGFYTIQRVKDFEFIAVEGGVFAQAFVDAGIFGVAAVFVPQEVVLAVQLFDFGIDGFEYGDVCLHFFLPDFGEVLFLEDAFQSFAQADVFGVFLIEVARQPFADFAHDVFQIVGKFEFGFADFNELKVNVFQRFIEQMGGVALL